MPKILINEVDNTSAGTPGRYGNYSVLLTGYMGTPEAGTKVEPDSNGVYEFTSATAFKNTIGEAPVEKSVAGDVPEYHYGNRMAIELLNLGYPVIYKVIDKIADMNTAEFWDLFRDKASYDFRFITHGLQESYKEGSAKTLESRIDVLDRAITF